MYLINPWIIAILLYICKYVHSFFSVNPQVWITLSSFTDSTENRLVEINWINHFIEFHDIATISLVTSKPEIGCNLSSLNYLFNVKHLNVVQGKIKTNIRFPIVNFESHEFLIDQRCLFDTWVIYVINDKIIAKNCLKTNPNWFENLLPSIRNKNLKEIAIAGTHDSGSYKLPLLSFNKIFYKNFALTQDETIYNQLIYGIRFFDFRVSYDNVLFNKEKLWITHGIIRMQLTVRDALLQIRKFLENKPKEIVLIDFHKFEKGFYLKQKEKIKERHSLLIEMILEILYPFLCTEKDPFNIKIGDLIETNQRAIISYFNEINIPQIFEDVNQYEKNNYTYFLTSNIIHKWPDADNLHDFEIYLNSTFKHCDSFSSKNYKIKHKNELNLNNVPNSMMAELTPKFLKIVFNKYPSGLRKMAQITNYFIDDWVLQRYHQCVNIIATDFFLGNNLIELTSKINQKRYP